MAPSRSFANDSPSLEGLWRADRALTNSASGELTIDSRSGWIASIGGFKASVRRDGREVLFNFGESVGSFRGERVNSSIRGFWIQPSSRRTAFRMASPIVLHRVASGLWRGTIAPLSPNISLYLKFERSADGGIQAFIRDPQRNIGFGRLFSVTFSESRIRLTNIHESRDRLEGAFDSDRDNFSLHIDSYDADFIFNRSNELKDSGFSARAGAPNYVYRKPARQDDGWQPASAVEVGMDETRLAALVQRIIDTNITSSRSPAIDALLIARHGRLVLDEYFHGHTSDDVHDIRSAGKSLTTAMVGISLDHGASFSISSKVYTLFSKYDEALASNGPRKNAMTVRDLLTMTSGYDCDDDDDRAPGNEDNMIAQTAQPDWTKYILDLPMARDPGGTSAVYCTVDMNLLGAIVSGETKTWLPALFDADYARPLAIRRYYWNLTPTGEGYAGGGAFLRPRDMMKLGQLYLAGGVWNGRRVVSKAWVDSSLAAASTFTSGSEGLFTGSLAPNAAHRYGYGWHIFNITVNGHEYIEYVATGNGGQIVDVIPALDMVVMFAASNYDNGKTWHSFVSELVPNYVIPAAAGLRHGD